MDLITDLSPLSPGLIDELEAFMAPVGEGCYPPPPLDARRIGGHQLPESPPDSGSENPYSPETQVSHTIAVSQTVLGADYMLVPEHINHEILHNDYIYEELKDDEALRTDLNDVVVLPQDNMDLGLRTVRHDLAIDQYRYPELDQGMLNPQLVSLDHEPLTPVYTSLQEPSGKKRKLTESSQVKCEPAALSPEISARPPPSVDGSEAGDDSSLQCIRFALFQQNTWHALYDCNLKILPPPSYIVGADKGFNFSQIDEAFVCQKKNHFQVTCQIQLQGEAHYVKTADGFKKINNFCLHFYGVKAEDPNQEVRIEQSQSDRTKKPFHPVPIEVRREGAKVTVGRLHFAETTNNNMRKKGRPNPDQRHFQLVVALRAHTAHADYMIAAHASDRIIVRASNPGQFESDCGEGWWQRGAAENSVHYSGRVGINTDRPDEACVIHGNLKVMGHIVHPSDARAKHNIEELDTAQQLKNVQNIRVVKFKYDSMFAAHSGLVGWEARGGGAADTGVLAQELRAVLPDAVREAGDVTLPNGDTIPQFLVVNKDRIFMENLGAVKELCKVTGHLESRIDQLERINRRLCKRAVQRRDSQRSSGSEDSRFSGISNISKSFYSDGNITIDQIRDIARSIRKQECCHKLSHNSPKFTRKQCKHCQGNSSKYGKYYNYNKTSAKCSNKSDKIETESNYPTYVSTLDSNIDKMPDENFSTISRKKNSCLWLRDDSLYGNSKLPFCCRKYKYGDPSGELISNKYLQIIITILIFVMAVCLVVMSALYFREHQQLVSLREGRTEKAPRAPPYKQRPTDLNRIQSLKSAQHSPLKKTAKEKGPHKTTPEYVTSTPDAYASMAALHATKNYVKSVLHMEASSPRPAAVVSASRRADVIGRCDALRSDNELDADCQTWRRLASSPRPAAVVSASRRADVIGRCDALRSDNELDADCQVCTQTWRRLASSPRPAAVVSASRRADVIGRCDALRSDNELDADCQVCTQTWRRLASSPRPAAVVSASRRADVIGRCDALRSDNELDADCQVCTQTWRRLASSPRPAAVVSASRRADVISRCDALRSDNELDADCQVCTQTWRRLASSPRPAAVVSASRRADVIGRCDALRSDNELDADCQSSCGLDTPQSYDNQEPFEANSDKEVNETRPPEPPKDKIPLTPVIPEKNNSDPELGPNALKLEKESFKLKEENLAESNYVIPNKNITELRLKREVRETNPEDIIVEQSEELSPQECEHVWVGAAHNRTLWGETVCAHARHNYTYALPLAPCLHATHLDIHFKTAKLKDVRLCEVSCKFEAGCDRERAKPAPAGDAWAARVPVDCNTDRRMKIRASFMPLKELCLISPDSKTPFVEFNIHIYRDCRN